MAPARILYVHGGILNFGGTEAYMMNYYRHFDRTQLQVDFVVHGFEKGVYDDEITRLGGKLYPVPVKSRDYFGNIRALRQILGSGRYSVVHSHMDAMNAVVLKQAKKCGVPVRISHSHSTQHFTANKLKLLLNDYEKKQIPQYATHLFACSDLSGEWLYGGLPFLVLNNAIVVENFGFEPEKRKQMRTALGVDDRFVVGHIGRLTYAKNHDFLLQIFGLLHRKKPDAVLLLVGEGERRGEIEAQIQTLGLQDSVIMTGNRPDVSALLQAMDVFCFPSLFEGLPVTLIEAQAAGLPCVIADTIAKGAAVTDLVSFLSLEEPLEAWADKILSLEENSRRDTAEEIKAAGYDIRQQAAQLQEFYLNRIREASKQA